MLMAGVSPTRAIIAKRLYSQFPAHFDTYELAVPAWFGPFHETNMTRDAQMM